MLNFYIETVALSLKNSDNLEILSIESSGQDLEDLLANCTISTEDWHGNEGPVKCAEDLSPKSYDKLVQMLNAEIACYLEYKSEQYEGK
jgi:hypothetical protein